MKLPEVIDIVKNFEADNHTRILTGCAAAAMIGAVLCAFKAGSVVADIIKGRKRESENELLDLQDGRVTKESFDIQQKENNKKTIVKVAKTVAPAVGLAGVSLLLMIKAQKDNESVIESLGVSLAASKVANDKLMETVKAQKSAEEKLLGEPKAKAVQEETVKEKLGSDRVPDPDPINLEHLKGGGVLYYDLVMDKYFEGPLGIVDKGISECTITAIQDMAVSVNEFYDAVGSNFHPKFGDILGWRAEDIGPNGILISKTSMLTESGKPCVCLDYDFHLLTENFL